MEDIVSIAGQEARKWRHQLHSHPEIAFREEWTSRFIASRLREAGLEVHTGLAGTGLVAVLGQGPKVLGLRAELDGLPLEERNDFAHRSTVPGQMHGCGHDGHMAMLAGAALALAKEHQQHPLTGRVCFIFQPAEENEGGARRMIEEGFLERFPLDAIFAIHNWPNLQPGNFGLNSGAIMAAFDRFDIRVTGRGAHAAQPQNGSDVILAQSGIVQGLHALQSRKDPMDPAVLSITAVHGGEAYNILPEEVNLRGTLRTFTEKARESLITHMRNVLAGAEAAYGVRTDLEFEGGYPATVNSGAETLIAREAAEATVGAERVVYPVVPDTGSEDFSCFLEKVPGSYVWIGNGQERGSLHNPHYDFNDEIIETGIAFWVNLTLRFFEGRRA